MTDARDAARAQQIARDLRIRLVQSHRYTASTIELDEMLADAIAQALAEVRAENVEMLTTLGAKLRRLELTCSDVIADTGLWAGKASAYADAAEHVEAIAQPAPERREASEFVWPQDVEGLIEMADDWPVCESDGGDMLAGDVLIKKLGSALITLRGIIRGMEDARDGRVSPRANPTPERREEQP